METDLEMSRPTVDQHLLAGIPLLLYKMDGGTEFVNREFLVHVVMPVDTKVRPPTH